MEPKYRRVLLKISGEALAGENHTGINTEMTQIVARQIKKLHDLGVQSSWAAAISGGAERALP